MLRRAAACTWVGGVWPAGVQQIAVGVQQRKQRLLLWAGKVALAAATATAVLPRRHTRRGRCAGATRLLLLLLLPPLLGGRRCCG